MTRLTEKHLEDVMNDWNHYENKLQKQTGFSLLALACQTLNTSISDIFPLISQAKVAAIPLSQGEGLITGFAESLVSIARHLGFKSHCVSADERGFTEYQTQDFDFAIYANDTQFFVERKNNSTLFDNNIATGCGFAEALHAMLCKNGFTKANAHTIIIRGCGPVGNYAATHLAQKGYQIALFDKDPNHAEQTLHALRNSFPSAHICLCTKEELEEKNHHTALLDAAPVAAQEDFFGALHFDCISAPCVPCCWPCKTALWHDPLQLGTAVMLIAALINNATFNHLS